MSNIKIHQKSIEQTDAATIRLTNNLLWLKTGMILHINRRQSWSWSDGSWIYSYICKQCLSLLKLCSNPAHGEVYSIPYICDKVGQWLEAGRWFSPGYPVPFTNITDIHNITEILLTVALNIITLTLTVHSIILNGIAHK
jgi:hypothetical protein